MCETACDRIATFVVIKDRCYHNKNRYDVYVREITRVSTFGLLISHYGHTHPSKSVYISRARPFENVRGNPSC